MAQDEAAAATTPLEVATHFPGSSGIRLPTDQTRGIDASKLFDVIARMGGAIAKLQDDLKTPPPWVADVSEKLKRMDKLDQGFSSLTDVVGDLMSVTNVKDDQIEQDMDAIKKSVCRTEKEAALQTPDPFQLAQFNQLKGRLDNFENKQACAPAYEDVEQLKDYVRERSKKLKATLVNLQQQMERRFDQRLKDQIGNFGIWQANFTQVNSGRQQVLEDKIGENYNVFNEFRMTVNRSMEDAMQATHENNLYAKREFQTVNGQTLQLQAVLHDVVVRLDAAEKKVQANIEVVDNLVKMTNERLARHDEKAAEAETRLQLLEAQVNTNEKRTEDLEEHAKGTDCDIQVCQERIQKLDDDLGDEISTRQKVSDKLEDTVHRVEVCEFQNKREREERIGNFTAARGAQKATDDRLDEVSELLDYTKQQVTHVDDLTRDMPDKLDYLDEEVDSIRTTIQEGAAMAEELKQGLKDMKAAQAQHQAIEASINNITKTVQKQEQKQQELVKVQEEAKEEAQKIVQMQEEAAEYAKEMEQQIAEAENKAQEQEQRVRDQVKVMQADQKKATEKLQEIVAVVEDDDPTGIPGVNKPGMAGSMASRPPEQQQKFMDNEAIGVAKACFEFEKLCNAKNHIPDLSQEAIMAIASSTLEMSAFIAGRVDRWAVGQQMMDRPADDPFGDHHVADQAQKEMEAWISDTERRVKALAGSNDVVTPLQLKARELFFEKCHHALRTGLTKHDQVLVTEKSALKHSQNIPTCVACNRPLPTKRSKGEKVRADRARAEKPATPKKQHREKDDPEYVMRGGFRMPKSLDGADPAQHASLPPLRPAPDDGERYRDGRVRSPGPGAPDDQLVDPWNAAEAGA